MLTRRGMVAGLAVSAAFGGLSSCSTEQSRRELIRSDLLPDTNDKFLTHGFTELAQSYPWITGLRKSVGFLCFISAQGDNTRMYLIGSCAIIDNYGTLILDAHERSTFPEAVQAGFDVEKLFVFFPVSPTSMVITTAVLQHYNDVHDVAFASTDPGQFALFEAGKKGLVPGPDGSVMQNAGVFGLTPVRVDPDYSRIRADLPAFVVGYPMDKAFASFGGDGFPLHASKGRVYQAWGKLASRSNGQTKLMYCKGLTNALSVRGNSGGGVFINGYYCGPLATGNIGVSADSDRPDTAPEEFLSTYTLAEFWVPYYKSLYPERYTHLGLNDNHNEPAMKGCELDFHP